MPITSIPVNDRIERFTATGGQTVFSYDFPVYAASDLEVRRVRADVETTLALGADYTVTGVLAQPGGTVVLTAAAQAGDRITIRSAQPDTRATDFADGGDLPADALDAELNRIAVSLQQHNTRLEQTLRFPVTDATTPAMPAARLRANRVLGFDANGAPLMLLATPPVVAPGTLTIDARAYVTMGASTDQSAGLQAAINAAAAAATVSYGGLAQVDLPGGYLRLDNSVTVPSFVSVVGRGPQHTYVDLYSSATINLGTAAPAAATRCQQLIGMTIGSANKSGVTYAVSVQNAYLVTLRDLTFEGAEKGLLVAERTNSVRVENTVIVPNQGANPIGLHWRGGATAADRSDILYLRNVGMTGQWSNATLLLWEGFANTLDIETLRLMQAKRHFHVRVGPGSATAYPAFLNAFNIQSEGAKDWCMRIEAGQEFKIVGSDFFVQTGASGQGNADTNCIIIDADAGATITRGVHISATRIGGCRQEALVCGARDTMVANLLVAAASQQGAAAFPALRLTGTAQDTQLVNIRAEEFGSPGNSSYLLTLDSGAQRTLAANLNAAFCQTGCVQDTSGNESNHFINLVIPGGATTLGLGFRADGTVAGGTMTGRVVNGGTTNGTQARWELALGVANAFARAALYRTGGAQEMLHEVGSAVSRIVQQAPEHRFRDLSGNQQLIVGALPTAYADNAAAATGGVPVGGVYRRTSDNALVYRT